MSKRKKRPPADESMDAMAAEGQTHEEPAPDQPPSDMTSGAEPTGFEVGTDSLTPVNELSPLASFEEVDAAIEAVLGEAALSSDDQVALAESEMLPVIDRDAASGAIIEMVAGEGSGGGSDRWEEPTRVGEQQEMAHLAAQSADASADGDGDHLQVDSWARLESIIESLLFAADRPLSLADVKRLLNERDGKKVAHALDGLQARHRGTGIELANTAGGWQFRTNPENAVWVAKLVAGRPARLSRAMLETLAIVAYRQPITRPEIDEIRGVDCGPVLKTLLERGLIRMIGKKEEVGRPILYGTAPEFLRTFSLKDLTELPTLRQFHELGAAEQARVDAEAPAQGGAAGGEGATGATPGASAAPAMPAPSRLPEHDPAEEDALLAELDQATAAASRAVSVNESAPAAQPEPEPEAAATAAPAAVEPEPETMPPAAAESGVESGVGSFAESSVEAMSEAPPAAAEDDPAAAAAAADDAEPPAANDTTRPPTSE
jgi:segregation and condensation protein B